MKTKEKSSDYIRLFGGPNMPSLINSIALEHYKNLKVMAIFRDNLWTTYIPKTVYQKTLKEGLRLFSNESLFKKYKKSFEDYKKQANIFFKKISDKEIISKQELKNFLNLCSKLWVYYSKTEFFYVDDAFKKSKENSKIAKNLKELEIIKNKGREFLNNMIFEKNGFINKVLSTLNKKFNIKREDLIFYSKEELLDLYNNKIVKDYHIKNRKKSYVFFIRKNNLIFLEGDGAYSFISEFLVLDKTTNEIKGIIANKGEVKGRARVFEYGYDNFHEVKQLIKEMEKGEILIADTTAPELMVACKKASAIITDQGGLLSHAAIISRELKIPCIVGAEKAVQTIKTGDYIEVNANTGIIRILKRK